MKNKIKNISILLGVFSMLFVACDDDISPLVEKLDFDRVFSPTELEAKVRNQIGVELTWTVADDADHYIVEFSNDSMEFNTIVKSVIVRPDQLPYTDTFESEEQYSVRIKGVSAEGLEDSKWTATVFKTDAENIFNVLTDDNIGKTTVSLSWPANSAVTHLIVNPGANEVKRDLTTEEIEAGMATIEGLNFDTKYLVKLFNGDNPKQRGRIEFTTLPEGKTLTPADDLNMEITNANDGDVFLLKGGAYKVYQGKITVDKSIKLKALSSENKPVINAHFIIANGVASAEFIGLEMNGSYNDATSAAVLLDHAFEYSGDGLDFGHLVVSGCYVHNYNKSLIAAGSGAFTVNSILVDNCVVSDIFNNGGDFIDFRTSFPALITVSNSTFSNCATVSTRDFFRLDGNAKGNAYDDGAHTPNIIVKSNTFYNVMNSPSSTKRFFYVRWQNSDEVLVSENNLFYDMGVAVYSNQSDTNMGTFSNNNYFNAGGFMDAGVKVYDASGTTLNPGFAGAATNDFTLSNQTLIDKAIGDPRWR